MIRLDAKKLEFSQHARDRVAERANGLTEERIRTVVLDRLRRGEYRVSVSAARLFVDVAGLSVVLALSTSAPYALTVHELAEEARAK